MESYKIDPVWKKKEIVGIDIGSHSIKAVQLFQKGNLTKLVAYAKVDVPAGCLVEGIIVEQEKVAELIKELLANSSWGKFLATRALTSLSESRIFTKILTLPKMSIKELAEAVNWEAGQYIPMALTDLYLDWQIVGPSEKEKGSVDVIFAAAPKSIVDSYLQTFALAGLELVGLEPSLTSVARAMIPQREKNDKVLVIDIGAENTNIAIFDNVIRVTGSTLVGGRDIQNVSVESVVEKKTTKKEKIAEPLGDYAKSKLDIIIEEAKQMVRYYEEKAGKTGEVNKVFLCGGPASLPGLEGYFKEKLGVETKVGNPWANISIYPIKPVPKIEAPSYTNAIGLALSGLNNE